MNKTELQILIESGKSTYEIASELGMSQTNVRYWLKIFSLKTKKKEKKLRTCGSCGEKDQSKFYGNKLRICAICHTKYNIKRGKNNRELGLTFLGSKCVACGFDKYSCSLDFHHLDPNLKDPNFASMRGWSQERLKKELIKCTILCKNCHSALHSGLINLNIKKT